MAALTVFRTALLAVAVAGSVDGSLAVTDGADTLSSSGSPIVVGSLAVTDDADTLVATGGQSPIGSLAVTDDTDTLVATGTPVIVGSLAVTDGTDTLVGGDASLSVGYQTIVWREWRNFISHRDGGPTLGKLEYSQHAEDPQPGVWWTTRANALIDFTGYTFTAKIHDGTTTHLTKTTGITGAAGSGTAPTGTPNIVIQWDADELLDVPPGEYTLELTPTSGGRQRNPIDVPIRIKASAP